MVHARSMEIDDGVKDQPATGVTNFDMLECEALGQTPMGCGHVSEMRGMSEMCGVTQYGGSCSAPSGCARAGCCMRSLARDAGWQVGRLQRPKDKGGHVPSVVRCSPANRCGMPGTDAVCTTLRQRKRRGSNTAIVTTTVKPR